MPRAGQEDGGAGAPRHDKRAVRSWILYDFANSIYPAVVTTAVFPVFYRGTIVGGEGGLGELWWGWAVAASAIIVAVTSPLLGAIADRSGARKRFLCFYVATCLVGVALMTTLQPGMIVAGFLVFILANVGFESANVFYNAYLPDIVSPERLGRTSGYGYGLGYLGSALGLMLALLLLERWGHIELVWLAVIAFFAIFSIPAFRFLPQDRRGGIGIGQAVARGFADFKRIAAEVWGHTNLRRFLFAFFFYIDGVLTIIVMAAVIATESFGFDQQGVIILFLIVQFSALAGAYAMAKPTDTLGPKRVLTGVLCLWVAAGIAAYFVRSPDVFRGLAVAAGFGLGSVQSASRAFMASLIPGGREAELFGFYALCGRSSSVLGPVLFGGVTYLAGGNQRPGFLVLTALFLIGLVLLQRVRDPFVSAAG
ncbi:MAG: MFS transporter [Gemmatimonadetes bacterium]|nr:MFS transporter [Gemmatimonadota bacterium]